MLREKGGGLINSVEETGEEKKKLDVLEEMGEDEAKELDDFCQNMEIITEIAPTQDLRDVNWKEFRKKKEVRIWKELWNELKQILDLMNPEEIILKGRALAAKSKGYARRPTADNNARSFCAVILNKLGVILSSAGALRDKEMSPEEYQETINMVKIGVDDRQELIRDLRAFREEMRGIVKNAKTLDLQSINPDKLGVMPMYMWKTLKHILSLEDPDKIVEEVDKFKTTSKEYCSAVEDDNDDAFCSVINNKLGGIAIFAPMFHKKQMTLEEYREEIAIVKDGLGF